VIVLFLFFFGEAKGLSLQYGFTLPERWIRPTGEETNRMVNYLSRFIARQADRTSLHFCRIPSFLITRLQGISELLIGFVNMFIYSIINVGRIVLKSDLQSLNAGSIGESWSNGPGVCESTLPI
jgi:hypothetical protein